ncbi:tRNA-specific 2-thiouridylase [Scheffersomyces xylosifermentans]|uniref:tRNA-specific 2-thiouridylase n=1 Tax=Scheffersomyces xylosifermentans TaxID=1304137 RepID=UPI00315DF13F
MSSGVDSSVAAALYSKRYTNVRGIYMANWSQTAKCTERDWNDVQRVCHDLGIPCERVNFEREYWHDVFQPMLTMYEKGFTPNPDTGCNKYVKFGKMVEYLSNRYPKDRKWWLVTGHYARVMLHQPSGEFHLLRAYSKDKDQSYYLSSIPKSVLSRVLMPIGHYLKPKIRDLAHEFNLHVSSKPDSQGLCFVSQEQNSFRDFLNDYIEPNPGNIVTEDGKVWGRHQGLWHATIGQKSSVSMPQGDPDYKGVWFVSEKNYERNELVIVKGRDNPKLYKKELRVDEFQWMGCEDGSSEVQRILESGGKVMFQYRSLQTPNQIEKVDESRSIGDNDSNSYVISLTEPVRALAPGQNVVLYRDNRVLGSGVIGGPGGD